MKACNNFYFKCLFIIAFFLFSHSFLHASDTLIRRVTITSTNEQIKIDGKLDENVWNTLNPISGFTNHWPADTGLAKLQTTVKITHDKKFIYIAAVCSIAKKPVVQTLKRDTDPWGNDGFYVVLDPVDQRLSGYLFGVNAQGAQSDGIVQGDNLTTEWDAKWYSAVKTYESFYTIEMAIPLSSLRFDPRYKVWGVNFVRSDMYNNTYNDWSPVPLQFYAYNMNFNGEIIWDDIPFVSHSENVIEPYINSSISQTYSGSAMPVSKNSKIGGDAKISLNPSLNLDVTVNPDFSQVEVDQQIINLDRFDPLLPEKRTFFLENSDLFTNFGVGNLRPFISRKIGLTDDGQIKPILAGARLTGNLNQTLRVGVMDIEVNKFLLQKPENYFVGVFEQKILKNSAIKGIVTNVDDFDPHKNSYNRLGGLEFNYLSNNNVHQISAKFHYTNDTFKKGDDQLLLLYYGYYKTRVNSLFYLTALGDNFNPQTGFSPYNLYYDLKTSTYQHKGYKQFYNNTNLLFPLRNASIYNISFGITNYFNVYNNNNFMEGRNTGILAINYKNTSQLSFTSDQHLTNVPFLTEYVGERVIPGNYWFSVYTLAYHNDNRRNLNINGTAETGSYFGGYLNRLTGGVNLRKQPFMNIGANIDYNHIWINNKDIDFVLLTSSIEFDFTKNLFWTSSFQFNTQLKNFNINSRFQWHFKPLSDIYLVYTDNYQTDIFQPRNRMLTLKADYWIKL